MQIRRFQPGEEEKIRTLHTETVRTSNSGDYSTEQIEAWTSEQIPLAQWQRSLSTSITYVAVEQERIVGFGEINPEGEIRRLYVHPHHQRRGVASTILKKLEDEARIMNIPEINLNSTITARQFYVRRGFEDVGKEISVLNGMEFEVYKMKKSLK